MRRVTSQAADAVSFNPDGSNPSLFPATGRMGPSRRSIDAAMRGHAGDGSFAAEDARSSRWNEGAKAFVDERPIGRWWRRYHRLMAGSTSQRRGARERAVGPILVPQGKRVKARGLGDPSRSTGDSKRPVIRFRYDRRVARHESTLAELSTIRSQPCHHLVRDNGPMTCAQRRVRRCMMCQRQPMGAST